jgi:anti-sigma factor RsiW
MTTERCEWRESLGALALGRLPDSERVALEAHLEGCAGCRIELESLDGVARLLPLGDPERFGAAPQPPAALADRVAAAIRSERRASRRRRRRLGLALGGATAAAAAAVLAIFVLGGGSGGEPSQLVAFSPLPRGMKIAAKLEPRPFGTEIEMYVEGVRSGTLCRVTLRGSHGERLSAGTFRYRYGAGDEAVLGSALDLSRTSAIVVRVGRRSFSAPVGDSGSA